MSAPSATSSSPSTSLCWRPHPSLATQMKWSVMDSRLAAAKRPLRVFSYPIKRSKINQSIYIENKKYINSAAIVRSNRPNVSDGNRGRAHTPLNHAGRSGGCTRQ